MNIFVNNNDWPSGQNSDLDTGLWVPIELEDGTFEFLPAGFMGLTPFREPHGKVLFLHGWYSDGSIKSWHIKGLGFDVLTPQLSNWWFSEATKTAQAAYDEFKPDVVVGSSRGAAAAMNIDTGDTPLVLLAPAWRRFGNVKKLKKDNVIVIHSPEDSVVDYHDSEVLIRASNRGKLVGVGDGHRLNCKDARNALADALYEFCPPPADEIADDDTVLAL